MNVIRVTSETFEAKRWPYYCILPLSLLLVLWSVLKKRCYSLVGRKQDVNLLLFDGVGKYGKVIKRNVTGWKAVDLIYNHRFGESRSLGGCLDDFWFDSLNCQAARNRFRLAKRELKKAILHLSSHGVVRILSLAAGTGQIESEAVADVKRGNVHVKAMLVDKEPAALTRAREFIAINNVAEDVEVVQADAREALGIAAGFKPHIIAMIAFLDYLSYKEGVRFISKLFNILPQGGYFITSNTMPNVEMQFVTHIVGWPLIYRDHQEISRLIRESGFAEYELIDDPLCIQNVVVARKTKRNPQAI